ncbi:MAG: hypothetical protein AB7I18_01035 [Candidatus Berkiella sp.]
MLEYQELMRNLLDFREMDDEASYSDTKSRVDTYVFADPERALAEAINLLEGTLSNEDENVLIESLNSLMSQASEAQNQFPFQNLLEHILKNPNDVTHRWLKQLPANTKLAYMSSQAIPSNQEVDMSFLLNNGHKPTIDELSHYFKQAIAKKHYDAAKMLCLAARVDKQTLSSFFQKAILTFVDTSFDERSFEPFTVNDTMCFPSADSISIEGHVIFRNGIFTPVNFTTHNGATLSFTDYDPISQEFSYSYVIDNEPSINSRTERFQVVTTDSDGDSLSDIMAIDFSDELSTVNAEPPSTLSTASPRKAIEIFLSAWPEKPFNERTLINELAMMDLNLTTAFTDETTHIDQRKFLFEIACQAGNVEIGKRIIDSTFVTPEAIEEAINMALHSNSYQLGILDYLFSKGGRIQQSQVLPLGKLLISRMNVSRMNVDEVEKYLKYCPKPLTDIKLIDLLIGARSEEIVSLFLRHGLTDPLKARLYNFTLPKATPQVTPQAAHQAVQPVIDPDVALLREELGLEDEPEAAPAAANSLIEDRDLNPQVEAAIDEAVALLDAPNWFGQINAPQAAAIAPKAQAQGPDPFYFTAARFALKAGYLPTADEAQQMAEKASAALLDAYKSDKLEHVDILKELGAILTESAKKELLITAVQHNNANRFYDIYYEGVSLNDVDIIDAVLKNPQPIFVDAILNEKLGSTVLQNLFISAHTNHNLDLANRILAKGFTPSELDWHQVLLIAIEQGDKDAVLRLLTQGVSARFNQSEALSKAITSLRPNAVIVQTLLDCGADPKTQGCMLPLKAIKHYREYSHTAYLDIAQILMKKIVPDQDLSDEFNYVNQGAIAFAKFQNMVFETIKASLKPQEKIAFELLGIREVIRLRQGESAGDESLSRKANAHFQAVVEPALAGKFNQVAGHSPLEKVANIEKEIKAFLLAEILNACKQNPSTQNSKLINYIDSNRVALVEGRNKAIMQGMRELATSNEDSAQIAWRAYDPEASYHRVFDNLLTPQMAIANVYTTAAASEGAVSLKMAAELVRYRVAMYFLAINDLNKENFIQQIADMRRANATDDRDCPSCYPGAIGRIGKLGAGHPVFQLPPERREIIQQQISAVVLKAFSEQIANSELDEAMDLYQSLVMLGTENAEEMIAGKVYYDEDWYNLRINFINSLGTRTSVRDKINAALVESKEPVLNDRDYVDFEKEIKDIAGSGRAMQLGQRFKAFREARTEILPEQKPAESIIVNPFVLTPTSVPAILPSERKKTLMDNRIKRFIEFEILAAICKQQLPQLDNETQVQFVKEIIDNAFANMDNNNVLQEAVTDAVTKFQTELNFNPGQNEVFVKRFLTESSLIGLSEEQAQSLKELVLSKQLTKDNAIFNELLKGSCTRVFDELISRTPSNANKPSV